jgi:hypothetical protein
MPITTNVVSQISFRREVLDTTLCESVTCAGLWFFPWTPLIKMSVTITVFLNVALNTITLTLHVNLNIFYGLVTKTNGDDNA